MTVPPTAGVDLPSPSSGSPTAPGPANLYPLPALRPRKRSKRAALGLVAAALAVVVALALFFSGVIPGFHLGSSGSGGGPSTSQLSYGQAATIAGPQFGPGWTIIAAGGISSTEAIASLLNGTQFVNKNCPVQGLPSPLPSVPAFNGTYSNGYLTAWVFVGYNASLQSAKLVLAQGGVATVLGTIAGASCTQDLGLLSGLSGIIDSPQAASAVASDAAPFLVAHRSANAEFFVLSGFSILINYPPEWSVLYTTCGIGSTGGTGQQFNATVNADTGSVLHDYGVTNVSCASTPIPLLVSGGIGSATTTPGAGMTLAARGRPS